MERKPYSTDLTEEQGDLLQPLLPKPSTRGRPRKVDLREIVNAILYLNRTGCQWRNARGSASEQRPQFAAKMPDHDLWIGFLRDPDGNLVGLMEEKRSSEDVQS